MFVLWAVLVGASSPATAGVMASLPAPTGPAAIGTTVVAIVDSARRAGPPGATGPRTILVQLWYPRRPGSATRQAPYVLEPGLLDAIVASGYYGVDSTALRAWSEVRTHAALDAPVAAGPHPLVTLSHGLGLARANYTAIAKELASHGYVVAATDHPYGGFEMLPENRLVGAGDDSTDWNDLRAHSRAMDDWARDLGVVLDRLASRGGAALPGAAGAAARTIDWARVAAIGHSSGGLAAIQAACVDRRIHAAIDMDGGPTAPDGKPLARFVTDGIVAPTLILQSHPVYADSDLVRRHRTRAEYEAQGRAAAAALDALPRRDAVPIYAAHVDGTGHMSFSDAPFVMPSTITRFGGRILDGRRCWQVTTATIRAFLDAYAGASPPRAAGAAAFERTARSFPELSLRKAGR